MGRASLLKRVTGGELHIGPSDKGKGVVVMTIDMYHEMSKVNTVGDREVTWSELQETQRMLRGHSRALARIVILGRGPGKRNIRSGLEVR